jgi:hypothetical protein
LEDKYCLSQLVLVVLLVMLVLVAQEAQVVLAEHQAYLGQV